MSIRSAEGTRAYWAKFTPEQRSNEMKRRFKIAREKLLLKKDAERKWEYRKRQKPSRESPFEGLLPTKATTSVTIRERLLAIEAAVAALKADLGL
jgi:hypothetical protein